MEYVKVLVLFLLVTLQCDCLRGDVRLGRKKVEVIHKGKPLQDLVILGSRLTPHDLDNVNEFVRPKLREESRAEGLMLQTNGIEDFHPLDLSIDNGEDPSEGERKELGADQFSDSDDRDKNEGYDIKDMPEYNQETKADFKGNQEAIDWLLKDPNDYNVKSYDDDSMLGDASDSFEHRHGRHSGHLDEQDEDDDDTNLQAYYHPKKGGGGRHHDGLPLDGRKSVESHGKHTNQGWDEDENTQKTHSYHGNRRKNKHFKSTADWSQKKDDAYGNEDYGENSRGMNIGNDMQDYQDTDDIDSETMNYGDGTGEKYESDRNRASSRKNVKNKLESQDAKLYNNDMQDFQDTDDNKMMDYAGGTGQKYETGSHRASSRKNAKNELESQDAKLYNNDMQDFQDTDDNKMMDYAGGTGQKYETGSHRASSRKNAKMELENQDAKLYKDLATYESFDDNNNFDNSYDVNGFGNKFKDNELEGQEDDSDSDDSLYAEGKQTDSRQSDDGRDNYNGWRYDGNDPVERENEDTDSDTSQTDDHETSDDHPAGTGDKSNDAADSDGGSGNESDEESDTKSNDEDNKSENKQNVGEDKENKLDGNTASELESGNNRIRNPNDKGQLEHQKHLGVDDVGQTLNSEKHPARQKSHSAKDDSKKENPSTGVVGIGDLSTVDTQTVTSSNKENSKASQSQEKAISSDIIGMDKNVRNDSLNVDRVKTATEVDVRPPLTSESYEDSVKAASNKQLPVNYISGQEYVENNDDGQPMASLENAETSNANKQLPIEQEEVHQESPQRTVDQKPTTKPDQNVMKLLNRAHDRILRQKEIKHSYWKDKGHRRHNRSHSSLPRIYSLADLHRMEKIVSSLRATASSRSLPSKPSIPKQNGDVSVKSLYYYPVHPTPQDQNDSPDTEDLRFSQWNDWSTCSTSCGKGTTVRARVCFVVTCPQKDMYQTKSCRKAVCQDELEQESLEAHNEVRTKHFSPPLVWSASLAKKAQKIADNLAGKDFLTLDDLRESKGESVAQLKFSGENVARKAIHKWYNEVNSYSFSYPKINERTRHFVQIVWKGTKKMGLAAAKSASGDYAFVVALYSPAADNNSHVGQNVLRAGHKHDVYATFRKRKTLDSSVVTG